MERLSPLDAGFLALEQPTTQMHISSLAIYEGPTPSIDDLRGLLERRIHRVPRFRQRLATVPFNVHRPVWIDDADFDLDAHLVHTALPESGTDSQLMRFAGRILSEPLPRSRPLWEMWLIEGLTSGRFAVLSKSHHSLFDGMTGADLHAVLLDDSPDPAPDPEPDAHDAEPEPNALELLATATRDRLAETADNARALIRAARDPRATMRSAADLLQGSARLAASLIRPAPPLPINREIGSRRRYAVASGSLGAVRRLKGIWGVSVNDVILAAVAGAVRYWQMYRGFVPEDVKVMVPVSMRADDERGGAGNRVAMVVVRLPASEPGAITRLEIVHRTMTETKRSTQAVAGDAVVRLSSLLPPNAAAAITRLQSRYRAFNLLVTNVPGPQTPLYLCGRRMLELFPQAPLAANQGLSIAALSYDGKLGFGLLGDHEIVPDLEVISRGLESSLDELVETSSALEIQRTPAPIEDAQRVSVITESRYQ